MAALGRAEARLAAGSYGRSVRSGQPIPDERLEADPLAELTIQEEEEQASEEDDDEPPAELSPGIHIERDPGHRSSRPAEATELAKPIPKEAAPFNKIDKGHLAACEQPPLFTAELRAALGSLRQ